MSINQSELDTLLVYALRYTMGRPSYAAFEVCGIISRHWDEVSPLCRGMIAKEALQHAQSRACDYENRRYYERIAALPVEVTQ